MSEFRKATNSIMAKKMQKSNGASTQPCFVPLEIPKKSVRAPESMTRPFMSSWKERMMLMNLSGHPIL